MESCPFQTESKQHQSNNTVIVETDVGVHFHVQPANEGQEGNVW